MTPDLRARIDRTLRAIPPGDPKEEAARQATAALLAAGADLVRGTARPDRPDPHIVAYTIVVDGPDVMLGHHKKSGRWLPPGGHVDPDEHPTETATREIIEELGEALPLITPDPIFVTLEHTVGANPHQDLTFWYLFQGDKTRTYAWDKAEFHDLGWFPATALPGNSEPQLLRFLKKLAKLGITASPA